MKLTDQQILSIFGQVLTQRDGPSFLRSYADAICCATSSDFLILRPASLILIAKYRLTEKQGQILVHNFPGKSA